MIICKQPEIGGAVPPHQDSTFLYTRPPSAVGFWIALEDATVENGCLSFAAGSHLREPVRKRFVKKQSGEGTGFEDVASGPLDRFPRDFLQYKEEKWVVEEDYKLEEVKAGDLVLIHGNLLHKSEKNLSGKSRCIYTFHIIEGDAPWAYDEKNWLQPVPGKGFTTLYGEQKLEGINRLGSDW
jgi:phytanoyl-CoA hydroxylase